MVMSLRLCFFAAAPAYVSAAMPTTAQLKNYFGTFEPADLTTIDMTLDITFPAIPETTFDGIGWNGAAMESCGVKWKCPAQAESVVTPEKTYASTWQVSSLPTFDWVAKANTKYTIAMVDSLYPAFHAVALNAFHWICVNIPASKDITAADCYLMATTPGAPAGFPKKAYKDAYFGSGTASTGATGPNDLYGFILFEQSKDFPAVDPTTGAEINKYGADVVDMLGGDKVSARAKGGWFDWNYTKFAADEGMTIKAVNTYLTKGNAYSVKVLEQSIPWLAPNCDGIGDAVCVKVGTAAADLKNYFGTMMPDVSSVDTFLNVDFPALPDTTFDAIGWNGAAIENCGMKWTCPAAPATKLYPNRKYASTYLTHGAPTFDWVGATDKKYGVGLISSLYPAFHAIALNAFHWLCFNIDGATKDITVADCWNFAVTPGAKFPKQPYKDALFPAGAPETGAGAPDTLYGFILFEQSTDFAGVDPDTGVEVNKYGHDVFDVLGGDVASAKAKGGWVTWNYTAFAADNGMTIKGANMYLTKGNAWSVKMLATRIPWLAPGCAALGDAWCHPAAPTTAQLKNYFGTFEPADLSGIGLLGVTYPAVAEQAALPAVGWDGAAIVSCGTTWKCGAYPEHTVSPERNYASTYLVSTVPTFNWAAKADKKYSIAMVVSFHKAFHTVALNAFHWICVNIPDSKDMSAADCYLTAVTPGTQFPKKPYKSSFDGGASFGAGAPQTGPAAPVDLYGFILFEQTTDFPAVDLVGGMQINKYGQDVFDVLGGDVESAKKKGGWVTWDYKKFATDEGMKIIGVNTYYTKGNVYSIHVLATSIPWLAGNCDSLGDAWCTENPPPPRAATTTAVSLTITSTMAIGSNSCQLTIKLAIIGSLIRFVMSL